MLAAKTASPRVVRCLSSPRPYPLPARPMSYPHSRQSLKQLNRWDDTNITIHGDDGVGRGVRSRREGKVAAYSADSPAPSSSAPLGPVLRAVGIACAGAFAFGYHLGVINGPLEAIGKDLAFAGNKALEGLVVSSVLAGATAGSLGGAGIADRLGRKRGLTLCALPMLTGPLLSATAGSLNAMVLGRFITGIAIGLSSALVPTYISEVAPTALRGTLGSLNQLMICFGILAALVVNVLLPMADWRTMFALGVVPAVVLGLGMLSSAESPAWLVRQGRRAEAAQVAEKLWGAEGPSQLEAAGPGDSGKPGSGGGAGSSKGASRAFWVGVVLFFFQQFSGINALVYFSTSVFKQAGITSDTLASAAVGATNVLGTIIATSIIEKAGRKQLLQSSYLGMGMAMLVMAAGFGLPALQGLSGAIAVLGTLAYILSFAIGAGPVTGLIVPELNPAESRGRAVSAAFVSHWVCNMAIGQTFLAAVAAYGLATVYAGFGAVALVGLLYISRAVPETKGKSFEQIQADLAV